MNITQRHISKVFCPLSIGELIDKITILKIKQKKMSREKLKNTNKELNLLEKIIYEKGIVMDLDLFSRLKEVNYNLWEIEDKIRLKERKKEFDNEFIELARSVYIENDKRANIKREINNNYLSEIIEEKQYVEY